jgi:hypothetical protein
MRQTAGKIQMDDWENSVGRGIADRSIQNPLRGPPSFERAMGVRGGEVLSVGHVSLNPGVRRREINVGGPARRGAGLLWGRRRSAAIRQAARRAFGLVVDRQAALSRYRGSCTHAFVCRRDSLSHPASAVWRRLHRSCCRCFIDPASGAVAMTHTAHASATRQRYGGIKVLAAANMRLIFDGHVNADRTWFRWLYVCNLTSFCMTIMMVNRGGGRYPIFLGTTVTRVPSVFHRRYIKR